MTLAGFEPTSTGRKPVMIVRTTPQSHSADGWSRTSIFLVNSQARLTTIVT